MIWRRRMGGTRALRVEETNSRRGIIAEEGSTRESEAMSKKLKSGSRDGLSTGGGNLWFSLRPGSWDMSRYAAGAAPPSGWVASILVGFFYRRQ